MTTRRAALPTLERLTPAERRGGRARAGERALTTVIVFQRGRWHDAAA